MRLTQASPPTATQTGTLTSGSAVVTGLSDTSKLVGALGVSGNGVPSSSYVLSIDTSSQLTLTQKATSTGSSSLTFAIEPLSLPEAKLHLRVDIPDEDTLIASLLTAARTSAETILRQSLITQSWRLYLDSFPSAGGYYNRAIREVWPSLGGLPSGLGFYPGMVPNSTGVINLPRPPVQSITSVQYYDFSNTLQTVPSTVYNVSLDTPSRIQPAYAKVWPIARPTIDAVQIVFVSGYGDTSRSVPDNVKVAIKLMLGDWYWNREDSSDAGLLTVPNGVAALLAPSDHGSYA